MLRVLAILFFFVCCVSHLQAKPDSARFVHFDMSNGLPSNNVYSLVKDKYGYTWFATDKGIAKYNGYSFTVYNTGNVLPEDDVWELIPDNQGRVWVYSFGYQFGYMKNGRYNELNIKSGERILTAFYLSKVGDLTYFFSGNDSLGDLVFIAGGLVKVFPFNRSSGIQKERGVIDSYMGDNLSFYVMDKEENIYQWDVLKGSDKYSFIFKANEPLRFGYRYRRSLSPKDEQYSFRFNDKTLYKHNYRERTIDEPITLSSMGADADENIYAFNPYFLSSNYNKHSVLITNKYLYTIDKEFKFLRRDAIKDIIPSQSQLAYYIVDSMSNKWFTTKGDGVWLSVATSELNHSEQGNNIINNSVYTGTAGTKSYWWNRGERTLYAFDKSKVVEKIKFHDGASIRSVTGNDDNIFIGGESGMYQYAIGNHHLAPLEELYKCRVKIENLRVQHRVILQAEKSAFEYVNMIKEVNGDIYSIGPEYVLLHSIKGDSLITEIKFSERFVGLEVNGSTIVFFNGQKMVIRNEVSGKQAEFDIKALRHLGIGNVKQIKKDAFDNWYFLGTEKLIVCNPALKKFGSIDLNVNIRDTQLDIIGNKLVIAGIFGVGYMEIKGACAWSGLNVLPNYIVSKPYYNRVISLSVTEDDFVIIKTDKGVFNFPVKQLHLATSFNTRDNDVFYMMLEAPYEKGIRGNDTFAIEQAVQRLKIDVVNYYGKGVPKYSYKASGALSWEESESGEIFISDKAPGQYHKILCKVKDDIWESKTYAIYIYRYPMWWQTSTWRTVFWGLGFLLLLGLVLLTIFITRYFTAKKNERRRALTELELQAIHSQINPHFIFNTLSAALYYINKKRFDDAYTHVAKFSQLLRSYLKSSHDRYVILGEEIKMLRNYIELQQIRFEEKFGYRIDIDNKLPIDNIRIPSLLLQPLVENAINHGLFHKENGGILLLKFEQGKDNTELVCTIDDNGVGREAAKKINESSSQKESYGTKLTHQLLDVFKQYENLDIKLDYSDKALPETGTIVTLTLKNIKYVT